MKPVMKPVISTVKCRDEDELFKTLSEELPVGVCIMQNGKFCYVNSTFPIAVGYTVDELVGKDSLEIVVPEDREMVKENTMKMLKGELRSPYQFRVTCKDGSIVWVMATVKPIQYHRKRATLGNYMEITGRKLIEEAVKESEERYKELANSVTDVFFAVDENLRYTYWNKASEILTGVRMEDAIGKSIQQVFPDRPWRKKAEKMYRKVLETQQLQTFVNDYDIHGRHYILEISAYPSRSGISVFVRDITEHKQAEEKLKESEQKYRLLFETSPDCIVQLDREGRHLAANPAVVKSLGVPLEKLIGKTVLEVAPQEVGQRRLEMVRKALDEWQPQILEDERAGRYFHHIIIPTKTSEQKETAQVITRDITERKQAEEALQKSEERYRVLAENAGEAILVVQDDVVKFTNPKGVKLSGYSAEELASRPFAKFIYPDDLHMVADRYLRRLRGEPVPQTYDFRIIRKDGDVRWGELNAVPISWEDRPAVLCFMSDITERKQAVEEVRRSEERYRTILEETGDGYFETDLAGNLTFVNDAMIRILGYSREEMIGMNFRAFTPQEKVSTVFEAYNRIYRTGQPLCDFPTEVIRKDGGHRFAESSAFPIKNDRGEIVGFRGVRRDSTARKQMEEALQHSEEKYRTILEEMEDSYFEVDLGGHLTFVNNSVCRDLRYSREELIGKSYKAFVVEEDIESVFQVFNEVYRTGVPNKGFPWKTIRKDGTHGFAETSISILRNGKGETIGFRGVGRDITERRQAEQRLRQSEENYRALFDSSVIGTFVLDAETMKVMMSNEAAAKIFGLASTQEAVGTSLLDFIPPEDEEGVLQVIMKELFEQDLRRTHELQALTKDGRKIWVSMMGARIIHGSRLAGLISFADITEQKRQNERLMMTDRLASIGELAAGAAHELNNPLTTIIGFSELLMEKDTPDYIRKDLAMIRSEARRAANVTNNLLTFARKHRPVKQLTRINDVIDDVLKLRAYAHKSDCIEVEKDLASDLPEIPLDHFQMEQVFINIVINAEYFMTQAHKKGTLTVTTKRQNSSVLVSFADDGPGIAAENLGRIFDPFFTTKEAGKGTGLGLSICHGIVAEHGGQIYATSQPGKGATIFIELPINGNNRVGITL